MSATVNVGDRLRNSDPRAKGKTVTVIAITYAPDDPGAIDKRYAHYFSGSRHAKIRFDRIVEKGEPTHNHFWTRLPAESADLS
jgi:hypothetical protein